MLNPSLDMPTSGSELIKKKKKQQLVKHKRKNWKKTDISEVEEGIEDLRQQKRTGGVRAEQKDEELFYISKTKLNLNDETGLPDGKRRKLTLQEKMDSLNCYRNLKPDVNSAPAHIVRDIKLAKEGSKRQLKIKRLETKKFKSRSEAKKRVKTDGTTDKENLILASDIDVANLNRMEDKKLKDKRLESCNEITMEAEFNKDVWTSSDLPEINHTNEYFYRSAKKLPIRRPKNPMYTKSALPSVDLPHPGTSYNPDYDGHQDLLMKAHLVELKKLKEEQKLMRKLALHAKKMSWAEIERIWLDEMSVKDLFEPGNDESDKEEEETKVSEEMSISKRELRRRLEKEKYGRTKANESKAKRLKKKLQEKLKLRQKENEKQIRIQQNEIYRLKSLKKEVDEKLQKQEDDALKRELEEKHKELFMPKRLNNLKFEEPELELKLSNEITGSLRTLKAEGNILRDRYKNLQKRNIIEPRARAKSYHKFWKKKFEKRNALEKTNFVFENNQKKNKK